MRSHHLVAARVESPGVGWSRAREIRRRGENPPVGGKREIQKLLLGNPGGSLEATRRSFNKDFLLALAADFKKHGAAAIEKVRKTQPAVYLKICALLVPREMKLEHSGGVKDLTDEELEQAIAAIKAMLAAQAGEAA